MARRKKHEEHCNHEAWAIPYGDLVTLLLALFVVMYSISTVNEGKFRVLSDALSDAFNGPAKTLKPVQLGDLKEHGSEREDHMGLLLHQASDITIGGTLRDLKNAAVMPGPPQATVPGQQMNATGNTGYQKEEAAKAIERMSNEIQHAMGDLIDKKMVIVHHTEFTLDVEIRTDILFASGSAEIAEPARPVLDRLASILAPFPNAMRIEGHTDNVPIHTMAFPSNWELSAARAASVVHRFTDQGVDPLRMSVAGFGQYRPVADNTTLTDRNRNRRVMIVVLAQPGSSLPNLGAAGQEAAAAGVDLSTEPSVPPPAADTVATADSAAAAPATAADRFPPPAPAAITAPPPAASP